MSALSAMHSRRVLVIDDNRAIHDDIRKVLTVDRNALALDALEAQLFSDRVPPKEPAQALFEVDSAYQGQEGLEILRRALAAEQPYALAIVDMRMPPGWDGLETIRRLWTVDPDLQVVICTAYSDHSWEDISRKLDPRDRLLILKKPFDNVEIRQLAYALSEKWRLQKALRAASEQRYRALYDDNPAMFFTLDRAGVLVSVNEFGASQLGYEVEELVGRPAAVLYDESDWPTIHRHLEECFQHPGAVFWWEAVKRHKDADLFWVREVGRSVTDLDGCPSLLIVSEDITEKRVLEAELVQARDAALAASNAKSKFLATMSHELRTPMNGVLGMAEVLKDTPLTDEQRAYVDTLRQSGQGLLAIINDILDHSNIEAGKLTLEHIPFDLERIAREVADILMPKATEKGLDLILDYAPECPKQLGGDPVRIRQVLLSLVGNAIKFSEHGQVWLEVAGLIRNNAQADLEIAIRDTGVGIALEFLPRVFESFTQGDGSTSRRFEGTGLGLAIGKRLVELMGGDIGVESEPGKGSTFWVKLTLPLGGQGGNASRVTPNSVAASVAQAHPRTQVAAHGVSPEPAIDSTTLSALRAALSNDFGEVLCTYLEDTPSLLRDLAEAHAEMDHGTLLRVAHSLKSSSYTIGASILADFAGELEDCLGKGDTLGVQQRIQAIHSEFERVRKALSA